MKPLFSLFICLICFAQDTKSIDQDILKETFNMNFLIADQKITEQLNSSTNYPKYYFFRAANHYQELLNSTRSKRDSLFNLIYNDANKAIEIGENLPETIDIKFWVGASYGYLGRYYGQQESWFKAFSNGKKGKNMLEEIIEEKPDYYDAYLGLGIFNYYADRLGSFIKVISWFVGMSGDREKGLKYLEIARDKGFYSKGEALTTLVDINFNLENNDKNVIKYANELIKLYPTNKFAYGIKFSAHLNMIDFDLAEKMITNDKYNYLINLRLINYYDQKCDFKKVLSLSEEILADKNLNLGQILATKFLYTRANWALGKIDKKYIKELLETKGYKDLSELKLIESNQTVLETGALLTYEIKSAIYLNKDNKIVDSLLNLESTIKSKDFLDRINTYKGIYYYKNNDLKKAEHFFMKSIEPKDNRANIALKFLTFIYEKETFPKDRVEKYLDIVSEVDSQNINHLSRNLKKKYDI